MIKRKRSISLFTFAFLFVSALIFNGCYVQKNLEVSRTLFILDEFETTVKAGNISKYIYNGSTFDYRDKFFEGLNASLKANNVIVVEDGAEADYVIEITGMTATETTSLRTIKDSLSAQNGDQHTLHKCRVNINATFYRGYMEEKVKNWNVVASKDEKLRKKKTTRLHNQVKIPVHTYTYETLQDSVFFNLSVKAGQRTTANITQRMVKDLK